MLRFSDANDRTPRTKSGQPAHNTTGVARTSCNHKYAWCPIQWPTGTPTIGNIANSNTGTPSAVATQNRRVMSRSSPSSSGSSAEVTFGSSAMPHFGQVPGPRCSISGCIGHV